MLPERGGASRSFHRTYRISLALRNGRRWLTQVIDVADNVRGETAVGKRE
jgi:hypothetical protein